MSARTLLRKPLLWVILVILVVVIVVATAQKRQKDDVQTVAAAVAVEVTPVQPTSLNESITAVGTIAAMHDVVVSSETAGRVTQVAIKVGDQVRQGQPMVFVDDELKVVATEQAKAQLLASETNFRKSKKDFERAETLFKSGDIADVELEGNRLAMQSAEAQFKGATASARAAERQLSDTRIKSPIDGIIASKKVEIGEMVSPGKEIANVVDISSVKIRLSISEDQIGFIHLKQPVALRVDSHPGETFEGSVYTVGSKTESPTGHTYPVEVVVQNRKANALKVGMFGRVDIMTSAASNALTISKESLVGDESDPKVFIVEQNVAHLRSIALGLRTSDRVQVVKGLKQGELVVSFGQRDLKEGTAVQFK
jgi:membrane fusion protein (multidrug efflux system)